MDYFRAKRMGKSPLRIIALEELIRSGGVLVIDGVH
jgi:hypothetical protein